MPAQEHRQHDREDQRQPDERDDSRRASADSAKNNWDALDAAPLATGIATPGGEGGQFAGPATAAHARAAGPLPTTTKITVPYSECANGERTLAAKLVQVPGVADKAVEVTQGR